MIRYRPFLNSDLPGIVQFWRRLAPSPGVVRGMTVGVFEQLILSKPFFDRQGLILAEDDDGVCGFVHAGFGPDETRTRLHLTEGVTCLLLVLPHQEEVSIRERLLSLSEAYLIGKGAQQLYAGCRRPRNPFYLGMYGGSELPGVLTSDTAAIQLYLQQGYQEISRCRLLEIDLKLFRSQVDRRQIRLRRECELTARLRPVPTTWWDACTSSLADSMVCELTHRRMRGQVSARVGFWEVEPLSNSWGKQAVGMRDLYVAEDRRRQGLATFLVNESMRLLQDVVRHMPRSSSRNPIMRRWRCVRI